METIRRNLALADMDIRRDERGNRRVFSIKFVSKEGKVYFIPQAYACGAGRMNMKEYQLRGGTALRLQGQSRRASLSRGYRPDTGV